jgi:superoxide dismutase, Cu-Zn family
MRRGPSHVRICEHTHASDSRGDTLRRITKAALGGVASCALILGGAQAATGALPIDSYSYPSTDLGDYQEAPGPFDGATGELRVLLTPAGSTFKLTLSGVDPATAGSLYGAHLHTGICVDGDFAIPKKDLAAGWQAKGHYNHDVVLGNTTPEISPKTEVWFDLVSEADGTVTYQAVVPFVPVDPDSAMSVVIHVLPTNPTTGGAGARQACLPLNVSEWAPTTL